MIKSKTRKSGKKPLNITARSITLVDAKGKARISLDAGDGEGFACIAVFGDNGTINICTQPNGTVIISMMGKRRSVATFSVGPHGHGALTVQTPEGRTQMGAVGKCGEHQLHIFRRIGGTGDEYGTHELSFEAPPLPRKKAISKPIAKRKSVSRKKAV